MKRPRKEFNFGECIDFVRASFNDEAARMTSFIPHSGERGRNDEERLRLWLQNILPKRFSIGNGFIVNSKESNEKISPHLDLVIFDEFYNSPLMRHYLTNIYPIEAVYAIIEVKYALNKKDLNKIMRDISRVRSLARYKRYVQYSVKEIKPGKNVVSPKEIPSTLPPRSFVFAYDSEGFSNHLDLKESIQGIATKNSHIHGLVVLNKNWFISQVPFADEPQFSIDTNDALLRFVNALLKGIASMPVKNISIDQYLNVDKIEWPSGWNPEEDLGA